MGHSCVHSRLWIQYPEKKAFESQWKIRKWNEEQKKHWWLDPEEIIHLATCIILDQKNHDHKEDLCLVRASHLQQDTCHTEVMQWNQAWIPITHCLIRNLIQCLTYVPTFTSCQERRMEMKSQANEKTWFLENIISPELMWFSQIKQCPSGSDKQWRNNILQQSNVTSM